MTNEEFAQQNAGLRRVIARLEAHNRKMMAAIQFTNQTLELCRDPKANPLAKMIDRSRAEEMLRDALTPEKDMMPHEQPTEGAKT